MSTTRTNARSKIRGGRNHDALLRSGIAEVFSALGEMAPQVARLQQGLLTGLLRAQEREIRRLSSIDPTDPRIPTAQRRAVVAANVLSEATRIGDAVGKVVAGAMAGNMFHGYVVDADGEPAVGYTVAIKRSIRSGKALKTKTDQAGYFRIEFGKAGEGSYAQSSGDANRLVERAMDAGHDGGATETPPPRLARLQVVVEVIDPNKVVVFRDPSPPVFKSGETVFRYYPLIDF